MDTISFGPEPTGVSPKLPLPFRCANWVGDSLRRRDLPIGELSEEAAHRSAIRTTGLSDFGDPYYREGLHRLLESLEREAHLHFLGRLIVRAAVELNLAKRLWLTEAVGTHTEVFREPLRSPIVVIGLPRTGTTFLHRMLAADPASRAIPMWELMRPLPNRRIASGWKASRWYRRYAAKGQMGLWPWLAGRADRKHYIRADTPEECMYLLDATFVSLGFWVVAPVYGYLQWYNDHDRLKPYAEYRQMLQAIQAADPGLRLTLKAPAHTGSLDALLDAMPEALIVQTHRDPVAACKSFNSLLYTTHSAVSDRIDRKATALANLRFLANEARRNLAARDTRPNTVLDVHYSRLVTDPIGTVRSIYERFGLGWSDAFEANLTRYVGHNPKGARGDHEYDSAAFGLTDRQIAEQFSDYCRRFELASE
ncbi:MAG: sulfotransferase [Sedimentisphaerales bacterium]|nr:sulfotransferase [Sedimentisphaerales bacterium]